MSILICHTFFDTYKVLDNLKKMMTRKICSFINATFLRFNLPLCSIGFPIFYFI